MNGAVGGLVAGACGCEGNAAISNSYATGSVRGKSGSQTGGIIGFTQENIAISATYSTGAVNGNGAAYKGGFIGFDGQLGDIATGYWDLDTSGISDPANGAGNVKNDLGLTGLTDTQLKSGLPAGFDPKIWGSNPNINNGYPYLLANRRSDRLGTVKNNGAPRASLCGVTAVDLVPHKVARGMADQGLWTKPPTDQCLPP